jgi:hypothetical protein
MERKQNTPSQMTYWRGKGKNPRPICPKCGRYMSISQSKFTNNEGKREVIKPNSFCKCGYVVINADELKKIPD